MIRAAIIDDVALARERVRIYLSDEPDIEIVGEAADGTQALELIERVRPDLAFIDIGLPDFDGLEVMARLSSRIRPGAIYLTAHDDRAVEAFDVAAVDYLLKPFDRDRFRRALARARARLGMLGDTSLGGRLAIKDGSRTDLIPLSSIDYIDVAGHYLCLHVGHNVHLLRMSLSELQTHLDPCRFARIHRSAIVQIDRIVALKGLRNGDGELTLSGGAKLSLSRTYADGLRRQLGL